MIRVGAPVEIKKAFELGGELVEVTVRVKPPTRALFERLKDTPANEFDAAFPPEAVAEWVLGWDGIGDADGNPLEPTADVLGAVRDACPNLYSAVVSALWEAAPKQREIERKN